MESPLPPNPYQTLNVAKDASLATIRSAHRKLVLTCHPDKIKDEAVKEQKAEQFHQVQQAYEILSDETKRQRYDQRVKLAELQAEKMAERGGSRGMPDLSSRAGSGPIFEVRVPSRVPEDDFFAPKFSEHRSTFKKFDDYYPSPPVRRSSARLPEERRKGRDLDEDRDDDRYYRQVMKEAEKKANHGHQKKKDKDKRKDREAKFSRRSYVEDDSGSDSDVTERNYSSRHEPATKHRHDEHRHDEHRRRDREETPRRSSSKRDDPDMIHDIDLKAHEALKTYEAMEYMQKSREVPIVEPRRPSTGTRQFSIFEARPGLSPILASVENGRRSGRARDGRRSSPSRKDRITEIVEPSPRKASLPNGSSDPRGLKHVMNSARKPSLRPAATMETRREDWHAPPRRSDSMPISSPRPRNEHVAAPSSRLRPTDLNDSDNSSSEWYQPKSTRYYYPEDEGKSEKRSYSQVKPADDNHRDRERERERERDISPRSRRPTDRRSGSSRPPSNARAPQRSASFAAPYPAEPVQSPRPPPLSRAETARPSLPPSRPSARPLYGEVLPSAGYTIVNQQPKIRHEDIQYSPRSPRETSRDTYAYDSSRTRPIISRRETREVY